MNAGGYGQITISPLTNLSQSCSILNQIYTLTAIESLQALSTEGFATVNRVFKSIFFLFTLMEDIQGCLVVEWFT